MTVPPKRRQFPLSDWIEDHADVPFSLGSSGMRHLLPGTLAHLAEGPRSRADDAALRAELAERLGVPEARVFLTHGATEANGLVLFYLERKLAKELGRTPAFRSSFPEYPPLVDAASLAGFDAAAGDGAELLVRSNPNNPTGHHLDLRELEEKFHGCRHWLLDETFREFTATDSAARSGRRGLWVSGTLTKAFGADSVRLGWAVAPEEEREGFRAFHGVLTDEVPDASVGLARDLLADADRILGECRALFERNRTELLRHLPSLGNPVAPVAFDRPGPPDAEPLCRAALEGGVLTCPGRFFGDPSGIRIGFTRPDFPEAFARYRAIRDRFRG